MTNLEILAAAVKLYAGSDSNQFAAIAETLAQSIIGAEKNKPSTAIYTLALPQSCAMAK